MKDVAAQLKKRNNQEKLQRIDDVVGELGGGDVQPEKHRDGEAQEGRRAQQRIDADQKADGNAPGQPLRGGADAQKSEKGQNDAAIERPLCFGARPPGRPDRCLL